MEKSKLIREWLSFYSEGFILVEKRVELVSDDTKVTNTLRLSWVLGLCYVSKPAESHQIVF